jgi:hypothetical protein
MVTTYDEILDADSSDSAEASDLERFRSHIGDQFEVLVPKVPWQLQLVEADPMPDQGGVQDDDGISLIFKAPVDCTISQGSVALDHEQIGWTVLYMNPIGQDDDGQYFEAMFN